MVSERIIPSCDEVLKDDSLVHIPMTSEKTKKTLLFVVGTRPEAIKMAPLIREFESKSHFLIKLCVTGQHRQMLDSVLSFFHLKPDFDLNLMRDNQTLFEVASDGFMGLKPILDQAKPDCVFVQGDTTSALVGAMAAYFRKIPVAHIEAGLRSFNLYSPFPEEGNRKLISAITEFHFAPTQEACDNLHQEGIRKNVWQVGNSVIDALFLGLNIIREEKLDQLFEKKYAFLTSFPKILLVTGHRRESFGKPFEAFCHSLLDIASRYPALAIVYPVHLNPNVQKPVYDILGKIPTIHLIEPVPYPELIWIMQQSTLVLTDSGGIQEEAPSLGKPVLVTRDVTERMEGVRAGTAKLVGTDREVIYKTVSELLDNPTMYDQMARAANPYGDGSTSRRIFETLLAHL